MPLCPARKACRLDIASVGGQRERPQIQGRPVSELSRARAPSGVYQVTQLMPPEGEAFQYRIKNANEPHERVAKESELRAA